MSGYPDTHIFSSVSLYAHVSVPEGTHITEVEVHAPSARSTHRDQPPLSYRYTICWFNVIWFFPFVIMAGKYLSV